FRAWGKVSEEMIEDVSSINLKAEMIVTSRLYFYPFKHIELLQSTGLKDKNGVEIFEGDIVSCFNENLSVVEYQHGGFGLVCNGYFESFINTFGEIEVLGSIHQHPHLLEE
ncbi:YopX family protein, partial [Staphylococcus xylosus]